MKNSLTILFTKGTEMKSKRHLLIICILLLTLQGVHAQWTTGTTIENTNSGDVSIKSGSDLVVSGQIRSLFPKSNTILTGELLGSNGYWGFRTSTSNAFHLDVYNSNSPLSALTVDQLGHIGIGTTSPSTKLHIIGTGSVGDVAIKSSAFGGGGHDFEVGNNGLSILSKDHGGLVWGRTNTAIGYGRFIANSYGITLATSTDNLTYSDRFFVAQAGNVGIGTTSPSYQLDVTRANHNVARFTSTGTNSGPDVLIVDADNTANRASLQIQGNGGSVESFFVGSTGRVGIGTTSPSQTLDISGSIAVNGQSALTSDANSIKIGDLAGGDGLRSVSFWSADQERLFIDQIGNVGIGTNSPADKLNINGGMRLERLATQLQGGSTFGQIFTLMNLLGSTDGIVYQADNHQFRNYDGTPELTINNGNVGIGTSTPSNKLDVSGTIRSEEVKVEAAPWPDYVFEEDYELRSLAEIEAYIKANKHLPEIPSAKEIETNGLALGEMNALLLKKIEELTLYLIDQQKINSELLDRIEKLENEQK